MTFHSDQQQRVRLFLLVGHHRCVSVLFTTKSRSTSNSFQIMGQSGASDGSCVSHKAAHPDPLWSQCGWTYVYLLQQWLWGWRLWSHGERLGRVSAPWWAGCSGLIPITGSTDRICNSTGLLQMQTVSHPVHSSGFLWETFIKQGLSELVIDRTGGKSG